MKVTADGDITHSKYWDFDYPDKVRAIMRGETCYIVTMLTRYLSTCLDRGRQPFHGRHGPGAA